MITVDAHYHMNSNSTLSLQEKIPIISSVIIPFLALIVGVIMIQWGWGITWLEVNCFLSLSFITILGITAGFHRHFTHGSFETTEWMKLLLGISGSMALQGRVVRWVLVHLNHHRFSDEEGDDHSPHLYGKGFSNFLKGFWHSHVAWLWRALPPSEDKLPERLKSPVVTFIDKWFGLWVIIGLLLPGLIGYLITSSWKSTFLCFLWGGVIRIFFVHHVTWCTNSICHIFGTKDFKTTDQSRNVWWLAIFSLGESWHNGHHAKASSARHGLLPGQIDLTYCFIKLLEKLGLAWDVRVPSQESIRTALAEK